MTEAEARQMLADAYETICDAVGWIDPHPPKLSKPIEALHVLEDWLRKYNETAQNSSCSSK